MTMEEFEEKLKECMIEYFGACNMRNGVLRALAEHLGVTDANVIFELAVEPGLHEASPYPILHFHCTLAEKVKKADVPEIVMALNELNTCTAVGAFPSFGSFGYYAPLQQIYHTYRMPFNPDHLEAELTNVQYFLGALVEQLDIFTDYILFICDHPRDLSLESYMGYLDSVSDLMDLQERLTQFEKLLDEKEKEYRDAMKEAGMSDEEIEEEARKAREELLSGDEADAAAPPPKAAKTRRQKSKTQ
ncbi:MAG: hypothetical protein K6F35_05810 [Lachnospiraceae bacterium]|nr:hypothetical protein [Lachnospiraceae bacterium]